MQDIQVSETILLKLKVLQQKLGTEDMESTVDRSLDITNYIADIVDDPKRKLLIERHGEFMQVKAI